MKKSIQHFLITAILAVPYSSDAQTAFTATPQLVIAEKPANLFVFYNYTLLQNLTGDTLEMRWVQTGLTTSLGPGELGDWTTAITDPESMYNPNDRDSAEFTLLPTAQATDKFILQLFPNDQVGDLTASFRFYPINDPADSVTVTFQYTATDPSTPASEGNQVLGVKVFPNPVTNHCHLTNRTEKPFSGQLLDMAGCTIQTFGLAPNGLKILDCSALPAGVFLLRFEQDGAVVLHKLVVQR